MRPLSEVTDEILDGVFDDIPDAVVLNHGTTRVYANRAYLELVGAENRAEVVGKDLGEFVLPADKDAVRDRTLARQHGSHSHQVYEYRLLRTDGQIRFVETRAIAVTYNGTPASLAVLRDVTERVEAERKLRVALSLQEATLESTADGILVVDSAGQMINFNQRFCEMWRLPQSLLETGDDQKALAFVLDQLAEPQKFIAKVQELYSDPQAQSHDTLEFKDGRVFERFSLPQTVDDAPVGRVWSFRDVTSQRRLEEQLTYQARHDPLTQLLNRRGFQSEIRRCLERPDGPVAGSLVLIDLDQFKDVNDSLGHLVGDEVLVELVQILQSTLGENAIVARLGGDEFAILLDKVTSEEAIRISERMLDVVRSHVFETENADRVRLTASAGLVLFPQHGVTVEQLMSRVDVALYSAKEGGRNRSTVYSAAGGHQIEAEERLKWRQEIRLALEEDRFELHAQPIMNLQNQSISHHELLLRLRLNNGEVIQAADFIGIAERSGLMWPIDRWVVTQAIQLLASLDAAQGSTFEVNLSGKAFEDDGLLAVISSALRDNFVDPARLVFEVTETAAISNLASAQKFIASLKDLGCGFALDDFGVGFSSFNHLKHLPVDYLKIDGSFVHGLATNVLDRELVSAMVGIAGVLKMETIAEFVESEEQLDILRELGVNFAQGYFIGVPSSVEQLRLSPPAVRAA